METWRPVVGFEGRYEVSSCGRVRSLDHVFIRKNGIPMKRKGKMLLGNHDSLGYPAVRIAGKARRIHQLMAQAFLPNQEGKSEVNHISGVKHDNRIGNLEWATHKENMTHAFATGLVKTKAIVQMDMNGKEIARFESITAATAPGINGSNITKCCKGGLRQTGGYKWKYA